MKKIFILLLVSTGVSAGELVDRIVAVVGKEPITLSDVRSYRAPPNKDPLEELIRTKLLLSEMDRLEIRATDDELADGIQEVLARNRMGIEELKAELARKGKSFEAFKNDLREEIRRMKFLGQVIVPRIRVSEEEIQKQLKPSATEEDRLRARQRLVEGRLSQELENYLDEVRRKSYVEIKK